jgi:hypothetical protein
VNKFNVINVLLLKSVLKINVNLYLWWGWQEGLDLKRLPQFGLPKKKHGVIILTTDVLNFGTKSMFFAFFKA